MTMDRREFVTTGLAAVAAAATPLAQAKRPGATFTLEIFFKGQFAYITEGRELYVSRLKPAYGHEHNGYIFFRLSALDPNRRRAGKPLAIPDPDEKVPDEGGEWYGYQLEGEITLLQDGRPLPAPSREASASARGAIPNPLDADGAWNDHAYLPQLATIAPRCEVKSDWRDECLGYFNLAASKLKPRKPCKREDIVAVWGWRNAQQQLTHISAVTDLVSYPLFQLSRGTQLTVRIAPFKGSNRAVRNIPIRIDQNTRIAALSAPPKPPQPARKPYTAGYKATDFDNIYRILKPTSFPAMEYVTQSADPASVTPTDCEKPYEAFDDDIFCPGGEPPPRP
jgi:hypothetical protein